MLFSSISFLYYFLPLVLLAYFVVPPKGKNGVLLIASLVFYAWGEWGYLNLILFSILSAFLFGILIEGHKGTRKSGLFFIISVCIQTGLLIWFKYIDFIIDNYNRLLPEAGIPLMELTLPLGISFYTFQILSYTIDLYLGKIKLQRNVFHFATYVLLFPQLIAGPIVRYSIVENEIKERKVDKSEISSGTVRFVAGLGKKVLLANTMGELCELYKSGLENSVLFAWMYGIGFTLQIYFDFSGYSDMAIGLGKIFGFHIPENFNYPYMAKSITEFWRRWHMTLGSWFRDYIYIPLGGNRVKKYRHILNILLVWMLTGLWHGASWQFVIWGLYFSFWLIMDKFVFTGFHEKIPVVFRHMITMCILMIGWILFDSAGLRDGICTLGKLFGIGVEGFAGEESLYYLKSYFVPILFCLIGMTNYPGKFVKSLEKRKSGKRTVQIVQPIFLVIMMIFITAYLIDGSYNPFIYFRF